jgi:hypothetical protein
MDNQQGANVRNHGRFFIIERSGMEKQVWIRQKLYDEAKQRCTVLEAENSALKAEVASIRIAQQAQVETIPPNCRICGCRIGCRFESGTRPCLNRRSA